MLLVSGDSTLILSIAVELEIYPSTASSTGFAKGYQRDRASSQKNAMLDQLGRTVRLDDLLQQRGIQISCTLQLLFEHSSMTIRSLWLTVYKTIMVPLVGQRKMSEFVYITLFVESSYSSIVELYNRR